MQEYEYVYRSEYAPVKNEFEALIKKAKRIMEKKYDLPFYYELIGSAKRHLITRIKGGNKGFDFDYNLIIDTLDEDEYYIPENVNEHFRLALNEACKGTKFEFPEDSTSAFTIKYTDKKNSKIIYSCDLAIIYYASDDTNDGYYYLKNHKNGTYSFELRNPSVNADWKLDEILEYANGWNWIRDEYKKVKNSNKDKNKRSFTLYLESIHNVYNQIQQWESNE